MGVATATSKTGRTPNVQPNTHNPSVVVEFSLDGDAIGRVEVKQDEFLSKGGNVLYFARIARGWKLPEGALERLSATVDGETANLSQQGVHLSAPRNNAKGEPISGTGGEPMAVFTAIVPVADDKDYMFNVIVKRLNAKAGKDQGHSLRIQGIPKAVGRAGGPQVVAGNVEGLRIEQS